MISTCSSTPSWSNSLFVSPKFRTALSVAPSSFSFPSIKKSCVLHLCSGMNRSLQLKQKPFSLFRYIFSHDMCLTVEPTTCFCAIGIVTGCGYVKYRVGGVAHTISIFACLHFLMSWSSFNLWLPRWHHLES